MSRALDVVTLTGAEYDDLLYDAERYRFLRRKFAIVGGGDGAEFRALNLPRPTYIAPDPAAELDAAIDASVCRQCGHDNDAHDRQYGCAEDGCDCLTPNAQVTGGPNDRQITSSEWASVAGVLNDVLAFRHAGGDLDSIRGLIQELCAKEGEE